MQAKLILVAAILAAMFLISGCDPDSSGGTQAPKKVDNPTTSQMPRSKDEAQKMFGNGGGGSPAGAKTGN